MYFLENICQIYNWKNTNLKNVETLNVLAYTGRTFVSKSKRVERICNTLLAN